MSYNKDKDDKAICDNKVMIKKLLFGIIFWQKTWGLVSLVFVLLAFSAANAKT